jgi:hypothetical protein
MKPFQFLSALASLAGLGQELLAQARPVCVRNIIKHDSSAIVAQGRMSAFVRAARPAVSIASDRAAPGATEDKIARLADAAGIEIVTETVTDITSDCPLSTTTEEAQRGRTTTVFVTATTTAPRNNAPDVNRRPERLPILAPSTLTVTAVLPPTTVDATTVMTKTSTASTESSDTYKSTTSLMSTVPPTTVTLITTETITTTERTNPQNRPEKPPTSSRPCSATTSQSTSSVARPCQPPQAPILTFPSPLTAGIREPCPPGNMAKGDTATSIGAKVGVEAPRLQTGKESDPIEGMIVAPQQDIATVEWVDDSSQNANLFCGAELKLLEGAIPDEHNDAHVGDCKRLADAVKLQGGYYTLENWQRQQEFAVLAQYKTCRVGVRKLSGDAKEVLEYV